ncbi:cell wall-binding protein, partial [Clostridium botulinum]|nr:cell wall-binding protein [Clostridium botulinum]
MMKKIKILKTIALTLTVASFMAIMPSNASAETWKNANNNWYYINSTGQAKTGWIQDNG